MSVQIQFLEDIKESTIPIIKLTKSKNGRTGTATFIFVNPIIFTYVKDNKNLIKGLSLRWENKSISTNDLIVLFKEGKPYIIKAVFIFKNNNEWFNFLNFISSYSKETGLSFFDSTN